MLSLRLEYLSDIVDIFVVVESSFTFTRTEKAFSARNVIDRLPTCISRKVRLIEMRDAPTGCFSNACNWQREFYQRNAILRGLYDLDNDDLVTICDVDEIPNAPMLESFKAMLPRSWRGLNMCMDMFYYSANNHMIDKDCEPVKWIFPKLVRPNFLISPQEVRMNPQLFRTSKPMGWHLSYMGRDEALRTKIKSYAHQENNTNEILSDLERKRKLRADPFNREYTFIDYDKSRLPNLILSNKYETFFFGINQYL